MVLLKAVATLSISIVDVSGEIEVLKKLNTVPFTISGVTVLILVLDEITRDSDLRNEKVHCRIVSFVWHINVSCPPGHTDAAFEDATVRSNTDVSHYKFFH